MKPVFHAAFGRPTTTANKHRDKHHGMHHRIASTHTNASTQWVNSACRNDCRVDSSEFMLELQLYFPGCSLMTDSDKPHERMEHECECEKVLQKRVADSRS
jgi:hypothetical protein